MLKRGQLSIIILTGLVLLIAVSFILYTNQQPVVESPAALEIPQQFRAAHTAITDCLQDKLETAIIVAGVQGGYAFVSDDNKFINFRGLRIPFWYTDKLNRPTHAQVETQLAAYLDTIAPECQNTHIGPQYTIISKEESRSTIVITNDNVLASVDMPLTIRSGDVNQELTRFQTRTDLPLGKAITHATSITDALDQQPLGLNTDVLGNTPANITVHYTESTDRIILLREPTKEGDYLFAFSVQLKKDPTNAPPYWTSIPLITTTTGTPASAYVKAADPEGSTITYDVIDNNAIIDDNGLLTVLLNEPSTRYITVQAQDDNGNTIYTDVEVTAT